MPKNYKVLFLQGGATGQFAGVPMNLSKPGDTVDYVNTGAWSKKAIGEAKAYAKVNVAADAGEPYRLDSAVVDLEGERERRLSALRAERDHRWRGISFRAGVEERHAAGGRYVLDACCRGPSMLPSSA